MSANHQRDIASCAFALLTIVGAAAFTPAVAQDNPVNTILFGSLDAGRSTFVNAGAKVALDDVNREGFVGMVNAGGGIRQERGSAAQGFPAPTLMRTTLIGAALGGYQFLREWGALALFAGPEASLETLMGNGAILALPPRFGLRLQGELWARPSENTLTTATVVLGSSRFDVYGRVSAGYRLLGAYVGPEAAYYGDRTGYQKIGLGVHATDFSFAGVSLRASVGGLYEPDTDRLGPYVALAAWAPFP